MDERTGGRRRTAEDGHVGAGWTSCPGFLSVVETFPNFWVERWEKGPAAGRRARQLRKLFGRSVGTKTVYDVRKLWSAVGADRVTVELTEITYCARRGRAPAPRAPVPRVAA